MSYFFICFFGEYLVEIEKISDFFGEKELQGVRGAYRLGYLPARFAVITNRRTRA